MDVLLNTKVAEERIQEWIKNNNVDATLYLSCLGLTKLPEIPSNCKELHCGLNKLEELPDLTDCERLHCYYNNLTRLPELPSCRVLYCYNNMLTKLPELPECTSLICSSNRLTQLPELTKCVYLDCECNMLTKLPDLPSYRNLMMQCAGNKYLYLTPKQCERFNKKQRPQYTLCAERIQKWFRRIIRKRVLREVSKVYIKNVSLVISQYF